MSELGAVNGDLKAVTDVSPRVLVFHPAMAPYRVDLFNALAERLDIHLMFLNRDVTYQSYDQQLLLAGLNASYEFFDRGFGVVGRQVRYGTGPAIARYRPDVVISHEFSPFTMQVMASRIGQSWRHLVWTADAPDMLRTDSLLRRLARRAVLPRLDGLIVYSEATRAAYRHNYGFGGAIGVSPNVQSDDTMRARIKTALTSARGLAESQGIVGKKIILYVGRLTTGKRVDRVIRAVAALGRQRDGVVLAIVGEGDQAASLQRLAELEGVAANVLFAGHLEGDALDAWYAVATVFVLPSDIERWGAVVNEALAAGVPVICSNRVGARELVQHGSNGYVFDVADDGTSLAGVLWNALGGMPSFEPAMLASPRPSLMTYQFQDAVDGFVALIRRLCAPGS